jgi:tRNA(Ile)-lysidine synthase
LTDRNTTRLLAIVRRSLVAWGVPSAGDTVVVALSGGADSVALSDALVSLSRELSFKVVLAHLDHQLRPESKADARFCTALGKSWGVPVRVGRADVRARAASDHAGLEDAARRERYAFLRGVREAVGARVIAVGHTRDDQAETFLLRLLRGAGTDGLASMRAVSDNLVRPLLEVSRAEVIEHLEARGLSWREDASNADPALMRNRVRHELLPYLESRFNPAVRETLARSAELLADDADALEHEIERRCAGGLRVEGSVVILPVATLREAPSAYARRMLRRAIDRSGGLRGVSAHHIEALRALVDGPAPSGHRLMLPGRREALVSFDEIRIGPQSEPAPVYSFALSVPGKVALPNGLTVTAQPDAGPPRTDGATVVIAAPGSELTVRTRRPGDRVQVGDRDVSLKRFLMKRRVPVTDRGGLPLVAAGERVLWIPGLTPPPGNAIKTPCVRLEVQRPA